MMVAVGHGIVDRGRAVSCAPSDAVRDSGRNFVFGTTSSASASREDADRYLPRPALSGSDFLQTAVRCLAAMIEIHFQVLKYPTNYPDGIRIIAK